MKKLVLFLAILLLAGCYQYDAETENINQSQDLIIYGQPGTHAQFPSIVMLTYGGGEWCSATLIKPDLVLTAAHCAVIFNSGMGAYYGLDDLEDADQCGGCDLKLKDVRINPDYSQFLVPWNDVAVILLEQDAPNAVTSPLLSTDVADPIYVGTTVTIAGYGRTETGQSGKLMWENVPVTQIYDNKEMVLGEDLWEAPNACYGDSGGPAYFVQDNVTHVVGVTSRTPIPNLPECGHGAVYTRPEAFTDWIESAYADMKDAVGGSGGSDEGGSGGSGGSGGDCDCRNPLPDSTTEGYPIMDEPPGCNIDPVNSGNSLIISLIFMGSVLLFGRRHLLRLV